MARSSRARTRAPTVQGVETLPPRYWERCLVCCECVPWRCSTALRPVRTCDVCGHLLILSQCVLGAAVTPRGIPRLSDSSYYPKIARASQYTNTTARRGRGSGPGDRRGTARRPRRGCAERGRVSSGIFECDKHISAHQPLLDRIPQPASSFDLFGPFRPRSVRRRAACVAPAAGAHTRHGPHAPHEQHAPASRPRRRRAERVAR